MSASRDALKTLVLKYNVPQYELEPLRLLDKRDTHMMPVNLIREKLRDEEEILFSGACRVCSFPVESNFNFCPYCGQRLQWSKK